ncbi:MAG: hypothetical protein ABL927_15430, partial [Bdellovibrionales bacterium]
MMGQFAICGGINSVAGGAEVLFAVEQPRAIKNINKSEVIKRIKIFYIDNMNLCMRSYIFFCRARNETAILTPSTTR